MKFNLKPKQVTFSYDFIIKGYLKRKNWRKSWTVYENPTTGRTIQCQLYNIDTYDNKVYLRVSSGSGYHYRMLGIPLNTPIQEHTFRARLLSKCLEVVEGCKVQRAMRSDGYRQAQRQDVQYRNTTRELAESIVSNYDFVYDEYVTRENMCGIVFDALYDYNANSRANTYVENYTDEQYEIERKHLEQLKRGIRDE